jgi:hypothetical protein
VIICDFRKQPSIHYFKATCPWVPSLFDLGTVEKPSLFLANSAMIRFRIRKTPEMTLWTTAPQDQYPSKNRGGYSTKKRDRKTAAKTRS